MLIQQEQQTDSLSLETTRVKTFYMMFRKYFEACDWIFLTNNSSVWFCGKKSKLNKLKQDFCAFL